MRVPESRCRLPRRVESTVLLRAPADASTEGRTSMPASRYAAFRVAEVPAAPVTAPPLWARPPAVFSVESTVAPTAPTAPPTSPPAGRPPEAAGPGAGAAAGMGSGSESDSAGVWRGTETIEVITAFRLAAVL